MPSSPSRGLNIALWIVQGLLALAFGMAGLMKMTQPPTGLVAGGMAWAGRHPEALIRFIGVAEFLGAVGLILPAVLRIQPKLTGVAAAALTLVMVLAMGEHATNGEAPMAVVPLVLGALTAFVAWGRLVGAPIAPR